MEGIIKEPRLYPFSLQFSQTENSGVARFPFIVDNKILEGPSCLISARQAGDMSFKPGEQNAARIALFHSLGLDEGTVFACPQIHSRNLYVVRRGAANSGPEADGMVCAETGIFLAVTVADCLPVYLADTRTGSFALLHSGWKGTGIADRALALMSSTWGTRPEDVAAVLGPCIGAASYRVNEERAAAFGAEFGEGPLGPAAGKRDAGWYIDLKAANARILADAGVRDIAWCENDTFTDNNLGSFRREGPDFTRMLAVIGYF
ncbi:MAG: polyphenol oxidase family protein [Treponema sp.]|jgi:YfiH family protein|nr:polyphenol oxidase family protein [Treponema sp.]